MPSNEVILARQLESFQRTLAVIESEYFKLMYKRINEELSRDEYMIYDMMDMMLHLQAVITEVNNNNYPGYMLEKLSRIKDYVDTTYDYYKSRCESISKEDDTNGKEEN